MRRSRLPTVARQLLAEIPDADLLERYVQHRADDAFAQLVTRYSRLVWGQCRNLLPGDADADDAFQATFLTLARSAKSIRPGAPLGPWLHGVAYRVCGNARRAMGRRAKREKACATPEADRPVADSTWEAAFAAVSEEVQKLPEAQRTAFVLCCIEGRATTEAAASLGQKLGTFSARLTRAKQTLLDRLAKRGLGASILALGGITGTVAVAPAALIARTLALVPSGVTIPSSVLTLTQGVTGMIMLRFKLLVAGVLVATGLGLSFGGGWSGEATAQVAGTTATKPVPPKEDVAVAQLKAELEKVKAMLAKAEADAAKKAMDDKVERSKRFKRNELDFDLQRDPKEKPALVTNFEYEPVPKEGLTDFEELLANREKAGWSFVGQVTIKGSGPEEKLVFRKLPTPPKSPGFYPNVPSPAGMMPPKAIEGLPGMMPPKAIDPTIPTLPGSPGGLMPPRAIDPATPVSPFVPGVGLPAKPPLASGLPPVPHAGASPIAPAASKKSRVGSISVNGNDTTSKEVIAALIGIKPGEVFDMAKVVRAEENLANSGLLAKPPKVEVVSSGLGSDHQDLVVTLKENPRDKGPVVDAQRQLDQARIAQLEKLLAEYQAGKAPGKTDLGKCYYRSEDFGNWELPQLIDVLGKVFADEIKAKKFNAHFRIESEPGIFTVNDATPDEIRAVTAWLKKLKK